MQIPGYTILHELGRGGMATVYLARQDRLGRPVALKLMMPQSAGNETASDDFVARFIKEGQIIAQLQHPHIVTIYDFNTTGELKYFSMEYLPGATLSQRIAQGLTTGEAVAITRCMAQALSVAHHNGVIHRDIKPQNILFRADNSPVLTDFGIARAVGAKVSQHTSVGMVVGSPRYMSPEQSMSRPIDARSDLYSLGVVFYEMLTGSLPYTAEDVVSLALKHCTAPIPQLPPELANYQFVLEKLLAKKPEERFGSTQELIRALDAITTGQWADMPDDERTRLVVRTEDELADITAAIETVTPPSDTNTAKTPSPPVALPVEPVPPTPPVTSPLWKRRPVPTAVAALVILGSIGAATTLLLAPPSDDPLASFIASLPSPTQSYSAAVAQHEQRALAQLRAGDLNGSFDAITAALTANPTDARLLAIKQRVLAQIQVAPLLQQTQTALARHQLDDAQRFVTEALRLLPTDAQLLALQTDIQQRLTQRQTVRTVLTDVSDLMAAGQTREALALLDKDMQRLGTAAQVPELTDLRATLEKQIAHESDTQRAQLLAQVDQAVGAGQLTTALQTLDTAIAQHPTDAALQQRRSELAQRERQSRAESLLLQAQTAQTRGTLDEGLRLVQEGLQAVPNHPELVALQSKLAALVLQQDAVNQVLTRVRTLQQERQLGAALEMVNSALDQYPDTAELLSMRGELRSAQQIGATAQAAEWAEQVRQLLEAEQLRASALLVASGLQRYPQNKPLLTLQQQITARQTAAAAVAQQLQHCATLRPAATEPNAAAIITAAVNTINCYQPLLAQSADTADVRAQLLALRPRLVQSFGDVLRAGDMTAAESAVAGIALIDPEDAQLPALRAQLEQRRSLFPTVVTLKAGCFEIGSPATEPDREADEQQYKTCVNAVALGRYEVTIAAFRRFVEATQYQTDAERGTGEGPGCWAFDEEPPAGTDHWAYHAWANWQRPNKNRPVNEKEPVTCVSWNDVQAYLRWLNTLSVQQFRLPTEAEWEYAARAGTTALRYWGQKKKDTVACQYANIADTKHDWDDGFPCDDGNEWAAPVGQLLPNAWDLHDMLGNVLEWTCSEYAANYADMATSCANPNTKEPVVMRGGAFNSGPAAARVAYRNRNYPDSRYNFVGFRVARDVQ